MNRPTSIFAHYTGLSFPTMILSLALLLADAAAAATLEKALSERDKGRSFTALAILEQLRLESPESERIKLEIALLRFQLQQYEKALDLLNEVLAAPDLPPKVRVNTQLLLVKARRMQRHQENTDISFSMAGGIRHYSAFEQTLVDSNASLRLTNRQDPFNMAGYAVTPQWVHQGVLQLVRETGTEPFRGELNLSSGLSLSLMNYRLQPGLNYHVNNQSKGLTGTLDGSWQARPTMRIGSHLEKSLAAEGRFTFLHYVQLELMNDRPFHLNLKYYGQSATEEKEQTRSPRLGSSLAYRKAQEWTLGGDWAVAEQESITTQEIFLRGVYPLNQGLMLTTELRHLSYLNNPNGWYGRLGILWKI